MDVQYSKAGGEDKPSIEITPAIFKRGLRFIGSGRTRTTTAKTIFFVGFL